MSKHDGNVFAITCEGVNASELVRRGQYEWVHDAITDKRFPIEPHSRETHTIELVKFDHDPISEEALAKFARHGRERPTHEDPLAFGIEYPEEQRERPVVFLHEPIWVNGNRFVLVLGGLDRKRYLGLYSFDYRWDRSYVFAAVRK